MLTYQVAAFSVFALGDVLCFTSEMFLGLLSTIATFDRNEKNGVKKKKKTLEKTNKKREREREKVHRTTLK